MSTKSPLPPSWKVVSLPIAASVNPRKPRPVEVDSRQAHFVPMACVQEEFGGIDVTTIRPMSDVAKGYTAFQEGDVLFAKITPCMENGKIAVVPPLEHEQGFGSTEFHVLRANEGVVPKWIAYFLSQAAVRRDAKRSMTGSAGQLRVPASWFDAQKLPLPSSSEQQRIIAKLEELFSDLEAGVAALERAKANLKRYRAAVLKAAVEGKLTEEWRAEHPDVEPASKPLERILAERRQKWETDQLAKFAAAGKQPPKNWQGRLKPAAAIDSTALPELPPAWTWATADELCSQITDGEHIQPRYQDEGFPMLTATHVRNGRVEFQGCRNISPEDFSRCRQRCAPAEGDVLIVSVGATTGRAGVVQDCEPFALVRSVLLLKPLISGRYLWNWIESPWCQDWIRRASGATAQAHFYISDAKRMPVPLPPPEEREEILREVDRRISLIAAADSSVDQGQRRAIRLRQSILKQAFSGRLALETIADADNSSAVRLGAMK